MENVPGLYTRGFYRIVEDLASCGYDAEWQCISAAAVGAPHLRERVWIVAYPCGKPELQAHTVFGSLRSRRQPWNNACSGHWEPIPGTYWGIHPYPISVVDDGISDGLARIAIGNSIVPHVAYQVFRAIVDIEREVNI